jgi:hypothetical protein
MSASVVTFGLITNVVQELSHTVVEPHALDAVERFTSHEDVRDRTARAHAASRLSCRKE